MSRPTSEIVDHPASPDGEEVLHLLRRQAALYDSVVQLASQQRSLITQENPVALLKVLAQRQGTTGEAAELAARLRPVREQWSTVRESLSTQQRQEADGLWKQAQDRLKEAMTLDAEDSKLLSACKEQASRQLQSTQSGRVAIQAYLPQGGSRRNLDERSC